MIAAESHAHVDAVDDAGKQPVATGTFFPDLAAVSAQPFEFPWERFVTILRECKTHPAKADLRLLKLARFGESRTDKGSLRHDANVLAITGIEGDYDAGKMSIREATGLLGDAGIEAVLYTTPSHTPEKPRWRVLCPLSKEHAPADRRVLLARLNGVLGGELGDESFTLSQSYYVGRVAGVPYEVQQVRGTPIDMIDNLAEVYPARTNGQTEPGATGEGTIPQGSRHTTMVSLAGSMRKRGMAPEAILAALLAENLAHCAPPMPTDEIERIAADIGAKPAGDPPIHPTEQSDGDAKVIAALAKLSAMAYDRVRKAKSEELGVRVSALDADVDRVRNAGRPAETGAGKDIEFETIEPWDNAVQGAAILDALLKTVNRFMVLTESAARAVVLWIVFTWFIDKVQIAPILAITSPEKRCGKTTLLDILTELTARHLACSNVSPAALFRTIEKFSPTLLIDEGDAFLSDNQELRGVLNSGHTRASAFVIRTTGEDFEPKQFSTWAAKAIALIGRLPDTLRDRSIPVELKRKLPGERRAKFRHADRAAFRDLRRKLARFADDNAEVIHKSRPSIPGGLHDRAGDNWEPLLAIADAVGGDWPQLARADALKLSGSDVQMQDSMGVRLLADVRDFFRPPNEPAKAVDRIASVDLLKKLNDDEGKPWCEINRGKPLTARRLCSMLSKFDIPAPSAMRIDGSVQKAYALEKFEDAFSRYLPDTPPANRLHGHKPASMRVVTDSQSVTAEDVLPIAKRLQASTDAGCNGVTDSEPPDIENSDEEAV